MRGPLNSKIPTLYIYGNEDQIIASLERRNYAIPHLVKLGGLSDLVAGTLFRLRAKTLKRLIRRQKESFWNAEEEGRRVLCVDFDEVWSSSEVISKFFGISDDRFLSEYPRRKPRVTDG